MEAQVQELEKRLGFLLPTDYREFLIAHRKATLGSALEFLPPRSGVIDFLLTADDILENDDQRQIGIPEKSLMHIGGNLMGGYLYLKVSEAAFGEVHYMEGYQFREQFPSFSVFLLETQPETA